VVGPRGTRRDVVGPHGGWVHEEKLNLSINMNLNSGKI
jgi:hypothetical protein